MGTKEQMVKIHQYAMENQKKVLIEKACKWILCNMPKYVKANRLDVFINNEDMANDFKQAMEE